MAKRKTTLALETSDKISAKYHAQVRRAVMSLIRDMRVFFDGPAIFGAPKEVITAFDRFYLDNGAKFEQSLRANLGLVVAQVTEDQSVKIIKAIEIIPVRDATLRAIEQRAKKITRAIAVDQRRALRSALTDGTRRGLRIEEIANNIRNSVGLLPAEAKRINAYNATQEQKESMREFAIDRRVENIVRTETIFAQNAGLNDVWQTAVEDGYLPPTVEKEWVAAMEDRTCPICEELDGQRVPLNDDYYSDELGEDVSFPPAHPSCRCTQIIRE